jgi:glutamate dehydrogenase
MPAKDERQRAGLIDKIVREARKSLKGRKASMAGRFVHTYYANVPPPDILQRGPVDLWGAASSHWKLASSRKRRQAKVRVYTPRAEKHGWNSPHTVVEIVTDDMPFLVDSVTAALNQLELIVHLVVHPMFKVRRDKRGRLIEVVGNKTPDSISESFLHIEVTEQSDDRWDRIRSTVETVLGDVRAAVEDWHAMRDRMSEIINELHSPPAKITLEETDEARDFLRWAYDDNFTFIGYRDYDLSSKGGRLKVLPIAKTALGILHKSDAEVFEQYGADQALPPDVGTSLRQPDLLMVTKSNLRSTVHRPVHLDAIGIKRLDAKGKVIGQHLFVGLFTSVAYTRSPSDIPLLRRKLQMVFERSGFSRGSHNGKALMNILETFPRDELFQISEDDLLDMGLGIVHLQDRQRVALFIRRDDFERFTSCLVFVPRERYTTDLRLRIQAILEEAFAGQVAAHYAQLGESPLARLHIVISCTPGEIPAYDVGQLEVRLAEETRSWADHLQDALTAAHGVQIGLKLGQRYQKAFPAAYRERFDAEAALADIDAVEWTLASGELGMHLYREDGAVPNEVSFKIYHAGTSIPLSDVLPMLEHMGLKVDDEILYKITPEGAGAVMIHDFGLETRSGAPVKLDGTREIFHGAFRRVWRGEMESDGFNGLVLGAGLAWREVVIVRAYCKYLLQAGIAFSQAYMEQTLASNPALTRLIVRYFNCLFDPTLAKEGARRATSVRRSLIKGLDNVVSADEDRILRRFINMVDCTLRTNFFQPGADAGPKPYVSFKLDSQNLEELPLPRPLREIFVYSPRVEGVHLRFGLVARGGLRWSDRREDFRTEVLGLVKAQQVKNAVIVPVGSKGGFVVKQPPVGGDREAIQSEGIACYKTFISGLFDLTDNFQGARVVPPAAVVRRDSDDPYLVVAADKGTATFSDIANGVSIEYGFWLGDAFASGGSQGYDHKKMGITARGAWESVKRHFREMGIDTQKEDFTVIGIGDMSGDVFGNGMLLSKHIKLLAAFNHLHIFVDPDPDPAKSFVERKRLFKTPRTGWGDYDRKLLSKGAAIFERRAKMLTLSPEIRTRFGIDKEMVTPNELMRCLLGVEVDLLWFGGIGTYVKSTNESHADAGDRANDAIRVNGWELRCRVMGEGANLGITQLGRIEYGLAGGRLNTDSIDNSAGVDCSDHEVNIKILLDSVIAKKHLDVKSRNITLAKMTVEVADLVLKDNYLQSQAISNVQAQGSEGFDSQVRLMRALEREGHLNRAVEFLPDDDTVAERTVAKHGLTRPELAVLMSYSKIWLYDQLLNSDLPDDPSLIGDLVRYFPSLLGKKYGKDIQNHRLRREIIATVVTNSMVNRVGGTFVHEFAEKTGMAPSEIAAAYVIARQVFGLRGLWQEIESLDNKVPAEVQTAMNLTMCKLMEWVILWFLRNGRRPLDIGSHVARYERGVSALTSSLNEVVPVHYLEDANQRAQPYTDHGVPKELALRVAGVVNLYTGCDIVRLATQRKLTVDAVARLYFAVGSRFHLGRLRGSATQIEGGSHWQQLAVAALIEEIYAHQLDLTSQVMDFAGGEKDPQKAIAIWSGKQKAAIDQAEQLLSELWSTEVTDLSMVAVASRQLRTLVASAAPS